MMEILVLLEDSHANNDLFALLGAVDEHLPGECTIESCVKATQCDLVKGRASLGR
jgi:hypothetical protein